MPWATAVLAGARAADGVYLPRIARIAAGLNTTGRLVVGEGPLRAWSPRAAVAERQPCSRSPLPCTGPTAEAMVDWSSAGIGTDSAGKRARGVRAHDRGDAVLAAAGDAVERTCGLDTGAAAGSDRG